MKETKQNPAPDPHPPARHHIRLPGFVPAGEVIGLGDVIKRVTYKMGIHACPGCERRAQKLNDWVSFTR
jgi:hypothetical protein